MTNLIPITIPRRMMLVRIVATCALMFSVVFTFNLWFGPRYYPRAPVFQGFQTAAIAEQLLAILALLLLAGSMFFRWQRVLITGAIAVFMVLIFLDVNRLQPWMLVYLAMLLVFVFYNGRVDEPEQYTSYFIILQVVFVSVYFFAGLYLLLDEHRGEAIGELFSPLRTHLSERQFNGLLKVYFVAPWFLMFTGVALLIEQMRYLAIAFSVVTHVLVFWLAFPVGAFADVSSWFVNLAMLAFLPLLCSGKTRERHYNFTALLIQPLFYPYFAAFVAVPLIRAGNSDIAQWMPRTPGIKPAQRLVLKVNDTLPKALPVFLHAYLYRTSEGVFIDHEAWCRYELRSDPFPHPLVFRQVARYIGEKAGPVAVSSVIRR
jgi:hypothetical protein